MQLYTYLRTVLVLLSIALMGLNVSCASGAKTGAEAYTGLGSPTDPVPFMEAARTGVLPNGLRYYILENAKPENRAYLTLAVHAGSVLEQDDERGLAHFIEHMAFNGTTRFPESELIQYLRSLGMRFGPEVNAYTSYDETIYGIEVPTEPDENGIKRLPNQALEVIDDWTYAITFDPKDVDDERLVIMEEYRLHLGATERIRQQILPILFKDSPYADRSPIGLPEIIEHAPASKLQHFYKTWYRGDNMALIFVGDFDGAALEASLVSSFSMPAPAETPFTRPRHDLQAPKKGVQTAIFTDPELPYTQIDLYYKRTHKPLGSDLAAYREGVVDYLIDQMLSLRFDEAASKSETPYVSAGAGTFRFGLSSRYYVLIAHSKTGNTERTLQELLRQKESMVRYGFTEAELDRAKRALLARLIQLNAEKDRQESAGYVRQFTDHFLKGELVPDIAWELKAVQAMLPRISSKDIAATVKDYFAADDLNVFVVAPEGEPVPSQAGIRQLVAQARKARIPRPIEDVISDQLLDEIPQPGTVIAESVDPETQALRWELSNGAQVLLKETRNQNNEIILYALARGGTTSAPAAEDRSASLAAEMVNASGLGPYSRQELFKKLVDKQVSLSFWTSPFLRGLQGSATTEDTKTLFEMLYLSFTQPRMDPDTVKALLDQYQTILAQQKEDPLTGFYYEIQRTIYQNHPRFSPMEREDLATVDMEDALNFIQDSLNPGDYTFVFTGNLDIPALRTFIETYLASIPARSSLNTWTDPHITRPGKTDRSLYKGKEERSQVYLGRYLPASYSEEEGAVTAVLEEYLDIKFTESIREKLGGVYTISDSVILSILPPEELRMEIFFGCDPKRVEELCAAIEAELTRIVQEPLDERTFTQAKAALKKSWESSIQSNTYIAQSYAISSVIYRVPLSRLDKRPGLYDKVTPEAVQAITQRLLQGTPVRLVLYPEAQGATP